MQAAFIFFSMYPLVYIYVGVHMPWRVCGTQRTMFGGCFPPSAVWPRGQAQVVVAGNPPHLSGLLTCQAASLALSWTFLRILYPVSYKSCSILTPQTEPRISISAHSCQHLKVFSFLFPIAVKKTHHRSSVREEGLFRHSLSGSQGGRAWLCCL